MSKFVRTLQFYQLAEGATQATQLIVGQFFNHFHLGNGFRCNNSLFIMLHVLSMDCWRHQNVLTKYARMR